VVIDGFRQLLQVVEKCGPARLAEVARELQGSERKSWSQLLIATWNKTESPTAAEEFLARAVLQPYAEFLRLRLKITTEAYGQRLCPFCGRKAGLGVLRQQGDAARRALVCSFCLAEWEFRRLVCPGCGEENDSKLPVYTAKEFDYIRMEGCDTCKTYIKTVDLTKNGVAEPMVDEMAAAPLDLWAQEHGYSKLQLNLMGM
jgi:FdhE protein